LFPIAAAVVASGGDGGGCFRGEAVTGGSGEAAIGCTEETTAEGLEEEAAALIPGEAGDDGRRGVSTHIRKWMVGEDGVCNAWSFFLSTAFDPI
jgi:hypothetical protein